MRRIAAAGTAGLVALIAAPMAAANATEGAGEATVSVSTYTVVGVERFDRQGLPDELLSRQGPERLRVITRGGEYDPDAGGASGTSWPPQRRA